MHERFPESRPPGEQHVRQSLTQPCRKCVRRLASLSREGGQQILTQPLRLQSHDVEEELHQPQLVLHHRLATLASNAPDNAVSAAGAAMRGETVGREGCWDPRELWPKWPWTK